MTQRSAILVTQILLLIHCTANSQVCYAQSISPFYTKNYSPVIQIHSIPFMGEATVLPKGESRTHLIYALSSHYSIEENNNEVLLLDGETTNITFVYQQGLGKGLQLGVEIPFIRHDAGSLDSFIDKWHGLFGLPEGGRDTAPKNRLRYLYIKDGNTQFDYYTDSQGIGDISLNVGYALSVANTPNDLAASLATSVSFPTGDSETFHGSGVVDIATWYKAERQFKKWDYQMGYFYSAGILLMGKGDVLPAMQKTTALFAGAGLAINFTSSFTIKTQLDFHSRLYNQSQLVELSSEVAQILIGGTVRMTKNLQIDFALAEDAVIDAAPDATFHVDFTAQF